MLGKIYITSGELWEEQPYLFYIFLVSLYIIPCFYDSFHKRKRKEIDEKFLQSPASHANGPYTICYSYIHEKFAKASSLVYVSIITLMRLYHFCDLALYLRTVFATFLYLLFIYEMFSDWYLRVNGEKLYYHSCMNNDEFTFDQIVKVEIDQRCMMRLCPGVGYDNCIDIIPSLYSPRLARDCRKHEIPFEYYKLLNSSNPGRGQKRDDNIE